ncbi:MAG: hypothetical protein Q7S80_01360 [bacterium]|nr:hypothetical protein [bacterium]
MSDSSTLRRLNTAFLTDLHLSLAERELRLEFLNGTGEHSPAVIALASVASKKLIGSVEDLAGLLPEELRQDALSFASWYTEKSQEVKDQSRRGSGWLPCWYDPKGFGDGWAM